MGYPRPPKRDDYRAQSTVCTVLQVISRACFCQRGVPVIDGVFCDFFLDAQREFTRLLTAAGYAVPSSATFEEVLFTFYNARLRRISRRPRRVHRSKELTARRLRRNVRLVVDQIARKAARGDDLMPFLHRAITDKPTYNDLLLNDWGLHHMHLGSSEPRKGEVLVKRSSELLFVRVGPDDLYLVDVLDHRAFAEQDLVEIMHANWRPLLEPQRIKGILGAARGSSFVRDAKERSQLRKGGVVTFTQTRDGTVYAPAGGGYATTGLNVSVVTAADDLRDRLGDLEDRCRKNANELRDLIGRRTRTRPWDLLLQLAFNDDGRFVVSERASGTPMLFPISVAPL